MDDDKFRSRKFLLAQFFAAVSSIALFLDKLSGGEFVAVVGVVLGLYGWHNVREKNANP